MQHPQPDDRAWPARIFRNRRLNQVPETENPATRLQFMHRRRLAGVDDVRTFEFVLRRLDDRPAPGDVTSRKQRSLIGQRLSRSCPAEPDIADT
jgi:hypothetical protein